MFKSTLFALFGVLLFTCTPKEDVNIVFKEATASVDKTVARIGVEGMMCEIACGGKIRKELSELKGVASADVEFVDGQPTNYAVVEYNPNLISEAEMVQCVNGIADGLYHVKEVEVTHYIPTANAEGGSEETSEVNMSIDGIRLPGITDLINGLAHFLR